MAQNITQWTATGSYSDASTQDITNDVEWSVSDTSIVSILGGGDGQVTIQTAGKIWGGDVGVTATLAPGTPGTGTIVCISSDSGSVAPLMPQQDNHWVALGLSPWGGWWGCQEPSGNLVGSGSAGFTFTAAGAAGNRIYTGAVTNWVRKALTLQRAATNGVGWMAVAGVGPNIQATSVALLGYYKPIVTGNAQCLGFARAAGGTVVQCAYTQLTTGVPRLTVSGTTTDGAVSHHDGRAHPYLIVLDRANSRTKLYTDLEKITGSWPATAFYDCQKGFGGFSSIATPSGSMLWMAYCTGSVAESLSDDGRASQFLKRLGWTNTSW